MCDKERLSKENLFELCPICGHVMGWHDFETGSCAICKDKQDMAVLTSKISVELKQEDRDRLDRLIDVLEKLAAKEALTVVNNITGEITAEELAQEIRNRIHAKGAGKA